MAVALTGAGSLGVTLGHIMGGFLDILATEGAAATARTLSGANWVTRVATLQADYTSASLQSTIDGINTALSAWQSGQSGFASYLQGRIQQTIINMVNADTPLTNKDLPTALNVLIRQMNAAGTSFNASVPSLGSQTSVGTPVGTAKIVGSVYTPVNGLKCQYAYPETLRFTCTADSQTGGTTAGRETVSYKGQAVAASQFAYNWPGGTGCSGTLAAIDGTQNNSSTGNLLYNSDAQVFTTANQIDNWTYTVGVAGTDFLNGTTSNAYTSGGGSLAIVGDGATLPAMTQQFAHAASTTVGSGGTPAILLPNTIYHFNGWVKCSATPSAGVLEFSLIDGGGSTVTDNAGNDNLFTKSLTAVSTSFVNFNGAFRTPASMPSTVKLKFQTSTAIETGKTAYLGRLSLAKATQAYAGGPYLTIHSGSTNMLVNDQWTMALSMTWGVFQREFERFLGMRNLGLIIPSDTGSPTVADSLVA